VPRSFEARGPIRGEVHKEPLSGQPTTERRTKAGLILDHE
jgi:hypothetical protein